MLASRRPSRAIERDLARLADGSLKPQRRELVEGMVAASSELQLRLHEQRRAVTLIRSGARDRAPLSVRAHRQALAAQPRTGGWPRMFLVAAAATAALIWTLSMVGGGRAGPTVADAATFALRSPTANVAAPRGDDPPAVPGIRAAGLAFPYWEDEFGWRATGVRRDRMDGRLLTTVFYRRAHQVVAYTIVPGAHLRVDRSAPTLHRNGVDLRSFWMGGRLVVTWLRDGHTCVLSGTGAVRLDALTKLAAWRGARSLSN